MVGVSADFLDRLKSFADLLGVVLVFLTLFTSQRQDALRTLAASSKARQADVTRELIVTGVLAVLSFLTLLAGAELFFHAVAHLRPLGHNGPTRSLFSLIWLLLLGLVVWQAAIVIDGIRLRRKMPSDVVPARSA
jgi:hypothetical protein